MADPHAPTAEQLKAQQEAARASREAAQKTATEGVDHRAAVTQKRTADYYEKSAASKPTPTQRENDLARVGALDIDSKEDDGSGPNMVPVTVMVPEGGPEHDEMNPLSRNAVGGAPGKYKTRDATK